MDAKIPRRWYQFRLSTILVLVGLLAWVMALRPAVDSDYDSGLGLGEHFVMITARFDDRPYNADPYVAIAYDNIRVSLLIEWGDWMSEAWLSLTPKGAVYPALALVAFVAWTRIRPRIERLRLGRLERTK